MRGRYRSNLTLIIRVHVKFPDCSACSAVSLLFGTARTKCHFPDVDHGAEEASKRRIAECQLIARCDYPAGKVRSVFSYC